MSRTESGKGEYYGTGDYEVHRVLEEWGLNYNLGAVVCYCVRNGKKPGEDPKEGLRKAIDHLRFEIERWEREERKAEELISKASEITEELIVKMDMIQSLIGASESKPGSANDTAGAEKEDPLGGLGVRRPGTW